jgi:hypothetical protein
VVAAAMKTRYLKTLGALALLAAMWAGFTYWERRKARESPQTESAPQEKILPVESSHIQSFTLKPRDGETVTCRREGGNWVIVEPKTLAADSSAASALLNSLTGTSVEQVVDAKPANLKDYGLERPSLTVEVATDRKPQKFTLLLGDETPTGGSVYAQIAGNPRVVTLYSYLKSSLDKKLFDLRDKRAVTLAANQLQRIEAEAKGKRWTLAKNPEGVWDLVLPPAVRADRFTVEGLADRRQTLSMQSIVAEDKKDAAKYGFGAPELSVRLSGPGVSQTLLVGKKEGERCYAMNSALEPVFTLDASFLTQFQKELDELRDKDLFSFSAYEVKRLEVETPAGSRVYERQPQNKWKQTAPAAKDVPADKVEALLNNLRDLRATSFPQGQNLAALGLTKPAYRFKVQFGEKNETGIIEASQVGEHVYARRSTDTMACEVSKAALEAVEKAIKELQ